MRRSGLNASFVESMRRCGIDVEGTPANKSYEFFGGPEDPASMKKYFPNAYKVFSGKIKDPSEDLETKLEHLDITKNILGEGDLADYMMSKIVEKGERYTSNEPLFPEEDAQYIGASLRLKSRIKRITEDFDEARKLAVRVASLKGKPVSSEKKEERIKEIIESASQAEDSLNSAYDEFKPYMEDLAKELFLKSAIRRDIYTESLEKSKKADIYDEAESFGVKYASTVMSVFMEEAGYRQTLDPKAKNKVDGAIMYLESEINSTITEIEWINKLDEEEGYSEPKTYLPLDALSSQTLLPLAGGIKGRSSGVAIGNMIIRPGPNYKFTDFLNDVHNKDPNFQDATLTEYIDAYKHAQKHMDYDD